jgi:branched-chain amino acid transport system substrate-binding protein
MTITPQDEPGVLMEVTFDNNGDLDRQSFLGEVVNGKQKIGVWKTGSMRTD